MDSVWGGVPGHSSSRCGQRPLHNIPARHLWLNTDGSPSNPHNFLITPSRDFSTIEQLGGSRNGGRSVRRKAQFRIPAIEDEQTTLDLVPLHGETLEERPQM